MLCLALGQGALRELSLAVPKYYTVSNNNNYLYSVSNNLSFGVLFWSKDINFSPAIPATAFILFSAQADFSQAIPFIGLVLLYNVHFNKK